MPLCPRNGDGADQNVGDNEDDNDDDDDDTAARLPCVGTTSSP